MAPTMAALPRTPSSSSPPSSSSSSSAPQILPPLTALPALSPSHGRFVHSPSHSVPPLGALRPRGCRVPGCATFAKIQGLCAAHFRLDAADDALATPTARLPSLAHLERPRLVTTPGYYHHHHHHSATSSPLYAPLPSLRRFSEPPPPLATPLSTPAPLPRVSPLHRVRAPSSDDAFAPFRRAQPARHAVRQAWQAQASSPVASSSPVAPAKATCRREHCANAARRKGLCMEHGGRHFCKMDGCHKCAHRGGYCIAHGGGRRCAVAQCSKSAQSGGVCYSHGGGKRCATDGCSHAARSGGFCIKHGKMAKSGAAPTASTVDGDDTE